MIDFFEAPEDIAAHLCELVGRMEHGREKAWSVDEMGERFSCLARGIIGFRGRVVRQDARFKLGQDERPEVFAQILDKVSPDLRCALSGTTG